MNDFSIYFKLQMCLSTIKTITRWKKHKLTLDYRAKHNEVNWDDIERMRHVLVHGYYKIRPKQLWETIVVDIPALKPIIAKLIEELNSIVEL